MSPDLLPLELGFTTGGKKKRLRSWRQKEFLTYLIFHSSLLFWQHFRSSVKLVGSILFTSVGYELLLEQKMSENSSVCLTACVNPWSFRSYKLGVFVGFQTAPVNPLKTKWLCGFLSLRGCLWTTSECLKIKTFCHALSTVIKF